jgi:hypothetical protein
LVRDTADFWGQVVSDAVVASVVTGKYLARYARTGKSRENSSDG